MKKLALMVLVAAGLAACGPAMTPDQVKAATLACINAGMVADTRMRDSVSVYSVTCRPYQ